jgi:hypothetical protein
VSLLFVGDAQKVSWGAGGEQQEEHTRGSWRGTARVWDPRPEFSDPIYSTEDPWKPVTDVLVQEYSHNPNAHHGTKAKQLVGFSIMQFYQRRKIN